LFLRVDQNLMDTLTLSLLVNKLNISNSLYQIDIFKNKKNRQINLSPAFEA